MENSPLDPVETVYEAAKRARARHSSDEPGDAARKRAARSGRRRMGRRIQVMRREPTRPSTGSSGACRAAGGIARSCHAGGRFERLGAGATHWRAPFAGTAACPSRATSRRGAHFTPGGADRPGIGRNGKRETGKAGMRTARFARHDDGADGRVTCVVRARVSGRRRCAPVIRPETGAGTFARSRFIGNGRLLRTPASSRSDRRPGARRRR